MRPEPLVALGLLASTPAAAYPTMIAHEYTSCAQCHVDPSGAGALTDYGRAQAEVLLRSRYGSDAAEPGAVKDFLFGWLPLPDAVVAQADARFAVVPRPGQVDPILMQADLRGGFQTARWSGLASLGVAEGAQGAWVVGSNGAPVQLVSRDWWLGWSPAENVSLRAGRMPIPFGIRTENHLWFARATTRTTLNDDQQVGLSVSAARRRWRAELMGIAGNYQVSPDAYRERGYAAYLAWALRNDLELGASSLIASARLDVDTLAPRTRQAHGLFARWSPLGGLAVLAEADLTVDQGDGSDAALGLVSVVEADWEPAQGFHVKAAGEGCDGALADDDAALGRGWLTLQWFFLPRLDLRADALVGPLTCTPDAESRPMGFVQVHAFL